MKRTIDSYLNTWRFELNRKVLLVRGARQVGKTYSIRSFAKAFDYFLEVNLEEHPEVHTFFSGALDPSEICEKLKAFFNIPIEPGKTLLFFDEIQACPLALKSLRFFYEKMPELHVVAAGSLLEIALAKIPSFGVGRISSVLVYPMSFREFLTALGKDSLFHLAEKASFKVPLDETIHNKLLELLRVFFMIGGMPAVVQSYIQTHDLRQCQKVIDDLINTLQDDFVKYRSHFPVEQIQEVFHSIAYQTGKKFVYSHVTGTGSHYMYKTALDLLVQAGLAHKTFHTAAHGIPLGGQINPKRFKAFLFDIGIHQRLLGLDISDLLLADAFKLINEGSLAELFVGLELAASGPVSSRAQLFYWHRENQNANAEVDFVVQRGRDIIPIEVKSNTRGSMHSMKQFLLEHPECKGLRLSQENISHFGRIYVIPIYMAETNKELS